MSDPLIDRIHKLGSRLSRVDGLDDTTRTAFVQECGELIRLAARVPDEEAEADGAVPADYRPPQPPPSPPLLGGQPAAAPTPAEMQATFARMGLMLRSMGLELVIRPSRG
jgi:hypothetical protein